ncbi:MAG: hypothetical protein B7X89_06335, partial [Sulfuricurvum sp. 17-40-25]
SSAVNSATITGGNGVDTLTATGTSQTLIGGAGNDVLKGGDLSTLTGGAGADIFKMNVSTNVNSYATITDFLAGDVIDLDAADAGTVVFTAAAITLASTAVFQDYANAAARALTTDGNNASWFQYTNAGVTSTYIVQSGDTTTNDFQNGVDSIIKITGAVDLSTASYNQTTVLSNSRKSSSKSSDLKNLSASALFMGAGAFFVNIPHISKDKRQDIGV